MRNLDVLRAVAVLLVLASHLILQLIDKGHLHVANYEIWKDILGDVGHSGVLFFFVHTALVLMRSMERMPQERLTISFYIRRIFRIYPLSIATIATAILFGVPQIPNGTAAPWHWNEVWPNLLLIQNILPAPPVIQTLWTLPLEVQMYAVLPLLYLGLKWARSTLLVLIVWLACVGAVYYVPLVQYFPCFLGGVLAYQIAKEKVFRIPATLWPFLLIGLAAFQIALKLTLLPDYRADFVTCMVLGGLIPNVVDLRDSLLTRTTAGIAKYSYGVYLCQDPVLWFAFAKLGAPAVQWLAFTSLMFAVPYLAFHYIEWPMIELGRRLADRLSAKRATSSLVPVPEIAAEPAA